MTDKKSLRLKYKALRKSVEDKTHKDTDIYNLVSGWSVYNNAKTVMLYISMTDEVDTRELIQHALADGKTVLVPKVTGKNEMKACLITGNEIFGKSSLGVDEPEAPVFVDGVPDLIIVPGLAFNTAGVRLGFGGGFYDRYLKDKACDTAGLCYEVCLAEDLIKDEYDVNVKYIITEKGIVYCGG